MMAIKVSPLKDNWVNSGYTSDITDTKYEETEMEKKQQQKEELEFTDKTLLSLINHGKQEACKGDSDNSHLEIELTVNVGLIGNSFLALPKMLNVLLNSSGFSQTHMLLHNKNTFIPEESEGLYQ